MLSIFKLFHGEIDNTVLFFKFTYSSEQISLINLNIKTQ